MIAGGAEAAVCKLGVAGFCAARSLVQSFNDNSQWKLLVHGIKIEMVLLWVKDQEY